MADPSPPRTDLEGLADEIARLRAAVKELQSPTGTQQYNAVSALQAAVTVIAEQQAQLTAQQEQLTILVSDLDQRITDFINENIDDIVAAQVAAALAGPDVTIGQTGGVVRMPSILTTNLSSASGRVVTWTAGDGRIGNTA
ncbi:ABC transporter C-terminal domain-containing protein [Microbacterium sp. 5K110]|jgi:hypothetical protein|uniref:ABC transporter C-terminal domain-containing protein n=1 Tax=Microbacterium sp. 5K110 TaxID=2578104 RepID=UPI0010FDB09E|nr:ABC transporter C-terminal domain-containing protein [Microbacterium sp. 5K110]TLF33224.1 hypothetical protein FE256_03775 [Microbacterium sp. 5K110]